MKTLNLITIVFLFVLFSCNAGEKTKAQKVTFGIYEIVKTNEIPNSLMDTIKSKNVQLENNTQLSVIGYIQKADSLVFQLDLSKENIKLVEFWTNLDPI